MNKFGTRRLVITTGASAVIEENNIDMFTELFYPHLRNEQGALCDEDWQHNERAIASGEERIFSAFIVCGVKFWVITEWDRSVTTILLPEEY